MYLHFPKKDFSLLFIFCVFDLLRFVRERESCSDLKNYVQGEDI